MLTIGWSLTQKCGPVCISRHPRLSTGFSRMNSLVILHTPFPSSTPKRPLQVKFVLFILQKQFGLGANLGFCTFDCSIYLFIITTLFTPGKMLASELNDKNYKDFDAIERACSVFSLIGCVFIISTFSLSRSFRKPITRLVFYASFGNMMSNVATLMARSYVSVPSSPACQFQGFLIQM